VWLLLPGSDRLAVQRNGTERRAREKQKENQQMSLYELKQDVKCFLMSAVDESCVHFVSVYLEA